jgi:hypothetical protein
MSLPAPDGRCRICGCTERLACFDQVVTDLLRRDGVSIVPFETLELEIFGSIVTCETVAFHVLCGRFAERMSQADLELALKRWEQAGLITLLQSQNLLISITNDGVEVWQRSVDGR